MKESNLSPQVFTENPRREGLQKSINEAIAVWVYNRGQSEPVSTY